MSSTPSASVSSTPSASASSPLSASASSPPIAQQHAPQSSNVGHEQQSDSSPPVVPQQVTLTQPLNVEQMIPSTSTAPTTNYHVEESPCVTGGSINRNLKALRVPKFDGTKASFEEFWCLFESLVDKSAEPVNINMARFRECLSGGALEAIRGLGVSEAEYTEAKEIIQSKFGGERRQLRAYMEELEKTPSLRNNDGSSFDRFTDLVRVTVAKLKAEGLEAELGEGTLHGRGDITWPTQKDATGVKGPVPPREGATTAKSADSPREGAHDNVTTTTLNRK